MRNEKQNATSAGTFGGRSRWQPRVMVAVCLLFVCLTARSSSPEPSRRTVRVAVQTFGFASKSDADALTAALRGRGKAFYSFPATVHANDGRAMTSHVVIVPVDDDACASRIEFGEGR